MAQAVAQRKSEGIMLRHGRWILHDFTNRIIVSRWGVKFIETESGEWIPGHERREDGYRVRIWVVEDFLEMVMVHSNLSVVSSINCEVVKLVGFVMCHH